MREGTLQVSLLFLVAVIIRPCFLDQSPPGVVSAVLRPPAAAPSSSGLEKDNTVRCQLQAPELTCKPEVSENHFDPRKESCSYVFFEDCGREVGSFHSGKECFLYCSGGSSHGRNKTQQNTTHGHPTAREETVYQQPEDIMLTFRGNRVLSFDLQNDIRSDVFDVYFDLRTLSANAAIMSLVQKGIASPASPKSFKLKIKNGKFGIEIRCNDLKENFYMDSDGVQEGEWNMYYVLVDQIKSEILMQLNEKRKTFFSKILGKEGGCFFFDQRSNNTVSIGGDLVEDAVKADISDPLIGCLTNVSLFYSPKFLGVTSPQVLEETNVSESNQCQTSRLPDENKTRCLEGSGCAEWNCDNSSHTSYPILSLTGNDYLSYRIYKKDERLQTFSNTFSFEFKTTQNDAILLYATEENVEDPLTPQFVSVSITSTNQLLFNINLGGESVSLKLGSNVADNHWHNVSISQEHNMFLIALDGHVKLQNISSSSGEPFFYFIFIGGASNLNKGLDSYNFFYGCLRNVEINDINILQNLHHQSDRVYYHGKRKKIPVGCHCQMFQEWSQSMPEIMALSVSLEEDPELLWNSTEVDLLLDNADNITVTISENGTLSTDAEMSPTPLPPVPSLPTSSPLTSPPPIPPSTPLSSPPPIPPPTPPPSSKIWIWALVGCCLFLLVLIAVICLLARCCKDKLKNERKSDIESSKMIPTGREEIPLLEEEPKNDQRHTTEPVDCPYGLRPDNVFRNNHEMNKQEENPVQRANETHPHVETATKNEKDKDITLNSINKDSNSKIPFKNQLSLESNTSLRHIDSSSSSEDSSRQELDSHNANDYARPFPSTMNQHLSEGRLSLSHNKNEQLDSLPYTKLNKSTGMIDRGSSSSTPSQEAIDIKKYYLIRQASKPPNIPPKSK